MAVQRGTVEGFIRRTRVNLELIEHSYANRGQGHVVTQLINSLLGILVFPSEHYGVNLLESTKMEEFSLEDWPEGILLKGQPKSVGDFVKHMRNAVAHKHVTFSSDSRELEHVTLTFEDYKTGANQPYWRAILDGRQLHQFCNQLMDLIENAVS